MRVADMKVTEGTAACRHGRMEIDMTFGFGGFPSRRRRRRRGVVSGVGRGDGAVRPLLHAFRSIPSYPVVLFVVFWKGASFFD